MDFEAPVIDYSHFETDSCCTIEAPIPQQNLPVSPLDRYEPSSFIHRELNSLENEYIQMVNDCFVVSGQFLVCGQLRLKKVKSTLLCGNKSIAATI